MAFIPQSEQVSAQLTESQTILVLSSKPSDVAPVAVYANGQRLTVDAYERNGLNIMIPGVYDGWKWEVTYYIWKDSETTVPEINLPALPSIGSLRLGGDYQQGDSGFVDLKLFHAEWSQWDLLFNGKDLLTDSTLETAILVSVWSDGRHNHERGWWGDSFNERPIAECLLWTLLGEDATEDNARIGVGFIEKAIQWLLDDEWLTHISVSGEPQKDPDSNVDIFAFQIDARQKNGQRLFLSL